MRLTGFDLHDGSDVLVRAGTFWWRGRSMVMLSGCTAIADIRHQPLDSDELPTTPKNYVFGFQQDEALYRWAAAASASVLLPRPSLVHALGDKRNLVDLAGACEVEVPRSVVLNAASPDAAGKVWEWFGVDALVVQLPENNLTGSGTFRVMGPEELAAVFAAHADRPLKVAEHVDGLDITISGCVVGRNVCFSGVSHQLVGIEGVANSWGMHCGNQLLPDGVLDPDAEACCAAICMAVGNHLARRFYAGMFGLDAIVTADGRVVVIELNPRVQSVTSLMSFSERGAGLLPAPGAHLLGYVAASPLGTVAADVDRPPLSQLVITAQHRGRVTGDLDSGRYSLHDGALRRAGRIGQDPPTGEEVLVWRFCSPGDHVEPGDRLCVAMFSRHVAPVANGRPDLEAWAAEWVTALERAYAVVRS